MAGIKALRKIQFGSEQTAGTDAAATTLWRGEGTAQDIREVVHPPEDVGILMGVDRTYIPRFGVEISFDETPATFEQLPYLLEAGVETETASQDGSGSDYIYAYNFPTTAQRTPRTYTLEHGDDQQAEQSLYCFIREFSLSGNAGEALNMSATWQGRSAATTTYTGTISIPTVEEILFSKGSLFIDGTGTYPATTQASNTLLNMELSVTTGHTAVFTADGELFFSFTKQVMPEVMLNLTFEHDATAVAEIAAWRAETARSVRLLFAGEDVETAGTTYSAKTAIIDLVGKWESFEAMGEQDGNDVFTGTLRCRYDGTAAGSGGFILVNELAALT